MFGNLRFEHSDIRGYDVLSFDLSESLMAKLWTIFANEKQRIARVGELFNLHMWDGEEGVYLAIEANYGTCAINCCMEQGRLFIDLLPEINPLDHSETLGFEQNWIRYAPIMRWIRTLIIGN